MKKGTINTPEIMDSLARFYEKNSEPGTIIEAIVHTKGKVGELVNLVELGTTRPVLLSRWAANTKVVHFTADEWRQLREAMPLQIQGASDHDLSTPPKQ